MGGEPYIFMAILIYYFNFVLVASVAIKMWQTDRKAAFWASIIATALVYSLQPFPSGDWIVPGMFVAVTALGCVALALSRRWPLLRIFCVPLVMYLGYLVYQWLVGPYSIPPYASLLFFVAIGFLFFTPTFAALASVFVTRSVYEENRLGLFTK